jgi:hypothetical protein
LFRTGGRPLTRFGVRFILAEHVARAAHRHSILRACWEKTANCAIHLRSVCLEAMGSKQVVWNDLHVIDDAGGGGLTECTAYVGES